MPATSIIERTFNGQPTLLHERVPIRATELTAVSGGSGLGHGDFRRTKSASLVKTLFATKNEAYRGALIDTIGERIGIQTPGDPSLIGKMVPEKLERRRSEISRSLIQQAAMGRRDLKVNGRDQLSPAEKAAITNPQTRARAADDAAERLARREAMTTAAGGVKNLEKIENAWEKASPAERTAISSAAEKLAAERGQIKTAMGDAASLVAGGPGLVRAALRAPAAAKSLISGAKSATKWASKKLSGKVAARPAKPAGRGLEDVPFSSWTPEMSRKAYLKVAPKTAAAEVRQLSAKQLRRIFPEGGPIPSTLDEVAEIRGFASFAKAHPAKARLLVDGATELQGGARAIADTVNRSAAAIADKANWKLFPQKWAQARQAGFLRAARKFDPVVRKRTSLKSDPRYVKIVRGPRSPKDMPEIELKPKATLDHNGAFNGSAIIPTKEGAKAVRSHTHGLSAIRPEQIYVNGKTLKNMDGVMIFGGHGSPKGFAGLGTKDAAKLVAEELKTAARTGRQIDKVVLEACSQRDKRWLLGGSNAQAFEKELKRHLAGHPELARVRVYAAERAGTIYSNGQQQTFIRKKMVDIKFTDGSKRARLTPGQTAAAAGLAVGGPAYSVGGYYVYRAVSGNHR